MSTHNICFYKLDEITHNICLCKENQNTYHISIIKYALRKSFTLIPLKCVLNRKKFTARSTFENLSVQGGSWVKYSTLL